MVCEHRPRPIQHRNRGNDLVDAYRKPPLHIASDERHEVLVRGVLHHKLDRCAAGDDGVDLVSDVAVPLHLEAFA